jgi:hypothetical protein
LREEINRLEIEKLESARGRVAAKLARLQSTSASLGVLEGADMPFEETPPQQQGESPPRRRERYPDHPWERLGISRGSWNRGLQNGDLHDDRYVRQRPRARFDLTGQRFGKLTALRRIATPRGGSGAYWLCRCDCGNEKRGPAGNLRRGTLRSCGCLRRETLERQRAERMPSAASTQQSTEETNDVRD